MVSDNHTDPFCIIKCSVKLHATLMVIILEIKFKGNQKWLIYAQVWWLLHFLPGNVKEQINHTLGPHTFFCSQLDFHSQKTTDNWSTDVWFSQHPLLTKPQQIAVCLPSATAQRENTSSVPLLLQGCNSPELERLLTETHWFRVTGLRAGQKGRCISKASELL